jgi:5,10-methylenetetrahydrofolate reductase
MIPDQEPITQVLLYMGTGLLGGVIGYTFPRIARVMRNRITRRDLDKEIIELLSKTPKGIVPIPHIKNAQHSEIEHMEEAKEASRRRLSRRI